MADDGYVDKKKGIKRACNWADDEINLLVEAVTSAGDLLTRKFANDLHNSDKGNFWSSTTEQINAVGGKGRTKVQVCKKWQDLKRYAKKNEVKRKNEMKKTGGGVITQQLSDLHEKIIQTIPACCIDGLNGEDTSTETEVARLSVMIPTDRTEEEIYVARAIENVIQSTSGCVNEINDEDQCSEYSEITVSQQKCDKESGYKPQKKKMKKGNDEVSDMLISLEVEQLQQLKQMNETLKLINSNMCALVDMKRNEVSDSSIMSLIEK